MSGSQTGRACWTWCCLLLVCIVAAGCATQDKDGLPPNGHLVREIPSTQRSDPSRSGPFTLQWQENVGIRSFWIVNIVGNHVTYVHPSTVPTRPSQQYTWERSSFDVDESTLSALARLLHSPDFSDLAAEYHSDVADGVVVQVRFEQAGLEKRVDCDNIFPPPVRTLRSILKKMLVEDGADRSAEEISLEQARQFLIQR